MVVGVKDSGMDDSDAYVIEDTVVDYAMVLHYSYDKWYKNIVSCIIESKIRHTSGQELDSETLLNRPPTCRPNLGHEVVLHWFWDDHL